MNESCHTYEWVMSHIWMSHITHTDELCHTCKWIASNIRMDHITHINGSCHRYEWVMLHICTLSVESNALVWMKLSHLWVTSYIQIPYSFYSVCSNTLLILQWMLWGMSQKPHFMTYKSGYEVCDTNQVMRRVTWVCYEASHTPHILMRHVTRYTYKSGIAVSRAHTLSLSLSLFHTHTHTLILGRAWRASMNEPCHTYARVMSHIWMSHTTHMNEVPSIVPVRMSHVSRVSHDTHMNKSCHTCEWVMSHTRMSHVYEW